MSSLGRPREEVVELIGGPLDKLGVPEHVDHPHLSPLDDDQLLAHVRFNHPPRHPATPRIIDGAPDSMTRIFRIARK